MYVFLLFFLKLILSLLVILVSVAFFTLFERSVLGYSHNRLGPNKLFSLGLLQPFSDALSLFFKLDLKLKEVSYIIYFVSPIFGLFLSVLLWGVFPFWGFLFCSSYSFLLFILISGFSVYFLLYSGWVTSTKFSLLGAYRSSAQSVSYEVVMIILFLILAYWWLSLGLFFFYFDFLVSIFFLSFPMFFCWLISCVAECNRSPFDFSEGESELVSGFNTEYGGGLFSLIFIGEYSSIIFLSFLSSFIFFSNYYLVFSFLFCFAYLWARCSFPRLRYDLLMMISWKGFLIFILSYFFLLFFVY